MKKYMKKLMIIINDRLLFIIFYLQLVYNALRHLNFYFRALMLNYTLVYYLSSS